MAIEAAELLKARNPQSAVEVKDLQRNCDRHRPRRPQSPALMTLTMRPTGLGHGVYKDAIDYAVFSGAWNVGRIYERRGFSDAVRFFWSLHGVVLDETA